MRLRQWQKALIQALLVEREGGRLRHRRALIGMGRKNGKSSLLTGLALWALVAGPDGGEVYSLAGDREQARITFGTARRMVELDPELSDRLRLYRDAIEFPESGSVWRVVSSDAPLKEGLSPTLALVDEVHVIDRELWDVMALAGGARREPLILGITTAGVRTDSTGFDSLCYELYQHGRRVVSGEVEDPSFFFAWWEPGMPEASHLDPSTWREANPGYDDLVAAEDFSTSVLTTPEAEFRTKRCNQWVATHRAWLPTGAWETCAEPRAIEDGAEVILGFDGSFDNDSTALSVVEIGEKPHLDVAAAWERPPAAPESWRVPILEVEEAVRAACRRWKVLEIVCDPARWARTYEVLADEGLPILEYPQSPERMVPATQRFYEAVVNRTLTQSGDRRLARHVANCVVKVSQRGSRIAKETKSSSRKIDLAIACVIAFDRALGRRPAKSGFLDYVNELTAEMKEQQKPR